MRIVKPSGRQQHTHKVTIYLTAEELHQLDGMTAHIRYRLGIRADRGRIVREALALVYRDLHRGGVDSGLVRGLRAQPDENPQPGKGIAVESGAQSGPGSARTDRGLATVSTRPKGA